MSLADHRQHLWSSAPADSPPELTHILDVPFMGDCKEILKALRHDQEGHPDITRDHFAVVATAEHVLAAGDYVIRTMYDDGIRVYVDDVLLIDRWTANHPTTDTVQFAVGQGRHAIRVEYFQIAGGATLIVDLLAENSPRLQPDFTERRARVLEYRTLALARLDRSNAAKESLSEYVKLKCPPCLRLCVEAQLAAWLGELSEAFAILNAAAEEHSGESSEAYYELAAAAACCSQAAAAIDCRLSDEFAKQSLSWLQRSVELGYNRFDEVYGDPDFVMLHGSPGFKEILTEIQSRTVPVVTNEFWMCDREVTRGQFEQFINDPGYPIAEKPTEWKGVEPVYSPTADHPAQQISWYDAIMYCNWLSMKEGLPPGYERADMAKEHQDESGSDRITWQQVPESTGYRLLTEVEWEYACRAGTTTEFSSGDDPELLVNYCQMYPSRFAALCGEKLPNGWGLHDMHGNVHKWCWDRYEAKRTSRVLRGGSFFKLPGSLHSVYRLSKRPDYRYSNTGFRVARTARKEDSQLPSCSESNFKRLELNDAKDCNGKLTERQELE